MDVLIALGTNAANFYSIYVVGRTVFLPILKEVIFSKQVVCLFLLFYLVGI